MRATPWLAAALLALVAGCGGSGTTTSEPATTKQVGTVLPKFATSENCAQLLKLGSTFAQALQASAGGADPQLADTAKAFQEMADAAPSEIRDEFHTIADAFGVYVQAWDDAGLAPGGTPTPEQIAKLVEGAQAFGAEEVQSAQERVSAWTEANCGG